MSDAREEIAEILCSKFTAPNGQLLDAADAILAAMPEILGAMVKPLVWEQIDEVTFGAKSGLGSHYTAWAIDGYGYCKFPNTPAGERFVGGLEAAKGAAQDHHAAQALVVVKWVK